MIPAHQGTGGSATDESAHTGVQHHNAELQAAQEYNTCRVMLTCVQQNHKQGHAGAVQPQDILQLEAKEATPNSACNLAHQGAALQVIHSLVKIEADAQHNATSQLHTCMPAKPQSNVLASPCCY